MPKREPQTKDQAVRHILWAVNSNKITKAEWQRVNRACHTLGMTNGETEKVLKMVGLLHNDGELPLVLVSMGVKYPV